MSTFPQVQDFLKKCNLLEYYDKFISEGFDQLQSLLDVTELDLIAMDVKRGHRRRLQREIATIKGIPPNAPLYVQHGSSGLEDLNDGQVYSTSNGIHPLNNVTPKILYVNGSQNKNSTTVELSQLPRNRSTREDDQPDQPDPSENGGVKRKYKRHPKRDKNAPVKPLSAYVMFAHKVREEYAGRNISFPDMAKIVGDRWKTVRPEIKESIENEAAKKKEEYQAAMLKYKTTDEWKKYQEYLKEFKEKYESNSRDSSKRIKRHKNETSPDSDNTTRSGYSSTRSTSVGCDNGSGNTSSESSNGNGNGNGHNSNAQNNSNNNNSGYPNSNTNYIPPYPHYNPTVPFGYTSNNNGQNTGRLTPPSTNNGSDAPSTILADLYAKDDSNAGDDQSQLGNGSISGNGSGITSSFGGSGSSSRRLNFEDSDNSTTSSNSTPPAVFMETDDNPQSRRQSSQNQVQDQNQDQNQNQNQNQDRSQSRQQENSTK